MGLVDVAVLAAVQGAAEALPVSATGHGAAARLWLAGDAWVDAAHALAAAAALALAVRRRLLHALGEGLRAVARPSLFRASPPARDAALLTLGAAASLLVAAALDRGAPAPGPEAPLAAGLGLLATGAALASTALAPRRADRARADAPSLAGMLAAGAAHGAAALPGGSRVGAALVLLLWLGVRPARAVELALALSIPALLVSGLADARALLRPAPGAVALGLLAAFLGALAGAAALGALAERRRTGALALWVVPLGLAMVAYARALPGPA
ncbi:undecaprenyl-diphosphate phosphatase [Sorangium cellulosum]|uniref:undecaprenyl-diphosphate phosphatase n=1 Tax=Sorangium cellulosum TaxID=56 RepID=UPI001012D50E|nr:undecaprenyl-diphosphate phosphatase [Sorangium cellulosum]